MSDDKTVKGPEVPPVVVSATKEDPPAKATTTSEEQSHARSQRVVNLIWEVTQALLALSIVNAALWMAIKLVFAAVAPSASKEVQALAITAFLLLSNLASLVIGFYFGRTNHQNVGGVQLGR